jgi:fluoride exporter
MGNEIRHSLLVGVGGMLGALTRYGVGLAAGRLIGKGFPWGTLIVNVVGCFAMGMVVQVLLDLEAHSAEAITPPIRSQLAFWHKGVAIGFLGGLTTFSSFGADTLRELSGGEVRVAVVNVIANVALSLAAVWCGMAMMQAMD